MSTIENAVTKAEVEAVLWKIRRARAHLHRIEQQMGGSPDLCYAILKLDDAIRRLTA